MSDQRACSFFSSFCSLPYTIVYARQYFTFCRPLGHRDPEVVGAEGRAAEGHAAAFSAEAAHPLLRLLGRVVVEHADAAAPARRRQRDRARPLRGGRRALLLRAAGWLLLRHDRRLPRHRARRREPAREEPLARSRRPPSRAPSPSRSGAAPRRRGWCRPWRAVAKHAQNFSDSHLEIHSSARALALQRCADVGDAQRGFAVETRVPRKRPRTQMPQGDPRCATSRDERQFARSSWPCSHRRWSFKEASSTAARTLAESRASMQVRSRTASVHAVEPLEGNLRFCVRRTAGCPTSDRCSARWAAPTARCAPRTEDS